MMVPDLHWTAIGLRLLLTVIAGTVLGMERSKSGHPAGLRTTLLVTLAASIAMIQMNLLIDTNGKPGNSYVVMDLMRLPLGILTGVGFIGAGAIVRKDEFVLGITTAATIWFSTVVGLCIGGGQLVLGCVSTLIGFIVLSALRPFEKKIEHYQLADLTVAVEAGQLTAQQLRAKLEAARFHIKSFSLIHAVSERREEFQCEVRWPAAEGDPDPPAVLASLGQLPGIIELKWETAKTAPQ
jgi:putative Mg2+ transporter-C (MgtC) family protein